MAFSKIKQSVTKILRVKRKATVIRGGEVIIKAMAISIPTYRTSYLKLSRAFCDELEKMMTRFW